MRSKMRLSPPALLAAVAATAAMAVSACAPMAPNGSSPTRTASTGVASLPTGTPERQCFWSSQVDNSRQGANLTVYLKVRGGTVYQVDALGACTELDFAMQLAIVPDLAGGDRLCSGDFANIVVPGNARPLQRCRVQITKWLTPTEIAALPAKYRP